MGQLLGSELITTGVPNNPQIHRKSQCREWWHKIETINQVPHWYPSCLSPSNLPQLSYPTPDASIASTPKSPSDLGRLPQNHRKTLSHFPPQTAGEGFQAQRSLPETTCVGGQKWSAPRTVLQLASAAPRGRQ